MKRAAICLAVLALAGCAGSEDDPAPLDANAHYLFGISAANIKATNNGANWDDFGGYEAPDVYCQFGDGTTTVDTAIALDSLTPTWTTGNGVELSVADLRSGTLTVQLWDSDAIVDDQITDVRALTFTDEQIRSGSFVISNWDGANSVTFVFVAAP